MKREMFSIIFLLLMLVPMTIFAKEIKPGVVITKDNYEDYLPELKRLLNPATFLTIVPGIKNGWITMPVVETAKYPLTKYGKATMANAGKFKVAKDNSLIGDWKNGAPFPHPKTGAELAWSIYRRREYKDGAKWPYSTYYMFAKDGSYDRYFSWTELKRHYTGRVYREPIPEEPGNKGVIESKEGQVFLAPFDLKSFVQLRIRYEALGKDDDVYAYIPALRRLRRLSGSDVTDPVGGSDLCMDDYEIWRQKVDPKMTFQFSERDFLRPRQYLSDERPPYDRDKTKWCVQMEWEIRPLWVLEINLNDPNYIYSKRVLYAEKDGTFRLASGEMFDRRGRIFRIHAGMYPSLTATEKELHMFWHYNCGNALTGHHTLLDVGLAAPGCPKKIFSIKKAA